MSVTAGTGLVDGARSAGWVGEAGRVGERLDAGGVVRAALVPPGSVGSDVDARHAECGMVIGRLLGVVEALTGHDLLAELLAPIAGDLAAVSSMQAGWREVAAATGAVAQNYRGLADQLPVLWEGSAAEAAVALSRRVAEAHEQQRDAAGLVADQLDHVLAVSALTADVVCAVLRLLDDQVQEFLLEAACGPLGWAVSAAATPRRVQRIVALVRTAREAVERLREAVRAVLAALQALQSMLDGVQVLAEVVELGTHVQAGVLIDDVARAGFR